MASKPKSGSRASAARTTTSRKPATTPKRKAPAAKRVPRTAPAKKRAAVAKPAPKRTAARLGPVSKAAPKRAAVAKPRVAATRKTAPKPKPTARGKAAPPRAAVRQSAAKSKPVLRGASKRPPSARGPAGQEKSPRAKANVPSVTRRVAGVKALSRRPASSRQAVPQEAPTQQPAPATPTNAAAYLIFRSAEDLLAPPTGEIVPSVVAPAAAATTAATVALAPLAAALGVVERFAGQVAEASAAGAAQLVSPPDVTDDVPASEEGSDANAVEALPIAAEPPLNERMERVLAAVGAERRRLAELAPADLTAVFVAGESLEGVTEDMKAVRDAVAQDLGRVPSGRDILVGVIGLATLLPSLTMPDELVAALRASATVAQTSRIEQD